VVIDELLVAEGSLFTLPTPQGADRTADTRRGLGGPRLLPGERRCVESNGQPGDHVAVNVTPVRSERRGYGTMHSSDDDAGDSSTVNFDVGSVDPNLAIVQVGADGRICFTNSPDTAVDLILDELAVAGAGSFSLPTPDGAARLADTRRGLGGPVLAPARPGASRQLAQHPTSGSGSTPRRSEALRPRLRHAPLQRRPRRGDEQRQFRGGTVDPNLAIVRVGADGRVCFTNSARRPGRSRARPAGQRSCRHVRPAHAGRRSSTDRHPVGPPLTLRAPYSRRPCGTRWCSGSGWIGRSRPTSRRQCSPTGSGTTSCGCPRWPRPTPPRWPHGSRSARSASSSCSARWPSRCARPVQIAIALQTVAASGRPVHVALGTSSTVVARWHGRSRAGAADALASARHDVAELLDGGGSTASGCRSRRRPGRRSRSRRSATGRSRRRRRPTGWCSTW
jgi:hypothetical protein